MAAMEYVTASGLLVHDKRVRAFPRDVDANGNDAIGTVGPNADPGYGSEHVMYADSFNGYGVIPPPMVQAWAGWPVEWATPTWGSMVGLGELTRRSWVVFAAIMKQAQIISTMPPYRTLNGKTIGSLAWMDNPQPEVYDSGGWIEAMEQIVISYLAEGEAFLWATSRFPESGRVRSFIMLNPHWVSVDLRGNLRTYSLQGAPLPREDVLHLRYTSWPGDARGHGPLEACARAMFGAEALERYSANLATRGGIPWAVLQTKRNLTAQQANEAQRQWVIGSLSRNGAPAVVSGDFELTPLAFNPKDMALLELRQFDESRIAVTLGVPPFLLALPSGADSLTYSTTESLYDFHWRSSLRPMAAKLMKAITLWTLTNRQEAIELNRDEYTRPAFAERVAAWATLHGIQDDDGKRAIDVEGIQAAERLTSEDPVPGVSVPAAPSSVAVPT